MTVMICHASSWLRTTIPRCWSAGRRSAGRSRSSRGSWSPSWRLVRLSAMATCRGTTRPSPSGAKTDRRQAPPLSGGSSWTASRAPTGSATGLGPVVEPVGELGDDLAGGTERGAVEAGDEHLADRGAGAGRWRGGRQVDPPGGLGDDGVDHGRQRVDRVCPCAGAVDGGHRARHGRCQPVDVGPVDHGRHPLHTVHRTALLGPGRGGGPLGAQCRDHRAPGDQAHGQHGDPPEPGQAATGARAAVTGANGHQPARARRRRRSPRRRRGRPTAGQPAGGLPTRRPEPRPRRGATTRSAMSTTASAGPPAQTTRRPPDHEPWSWANGATMPGSSPGGAGRKAASAAVEPVALLLEVGHHLGPLWAREPAHDVELLLGVVEESFQRRLPGAAVSLEDLELGRVGFTARSGFDQRIELPREQIQCASGTSRRRLRPRPPPGLFGDPRPRAVLGGSVDHGQCIRVGRNRCGPR